MSLSQTADVYLDECRKADAVPNHAQLNGIITQRSMTRLGHRRAPPAPQARCDQAERGRPAKRVYLCVYTMMR